MRRKLMPAYDFGELRQKFGADMDRAEKTYAKLRGAAFPENPDCRKNCTAFNLVLHDLHDQVEDGEIGLSEGVQRAGELPSVTCAAPEQIQQYGAGVVV